MAPPTKEVQNVHLPTTIYGEIQLLVEGNDQLNFFEALTKHLSILSVQVSNFGGVTDLREFLSSFAKIRNFEKIRSIGIVRDAEKKSAGSAFQSVQSALCNAALPVPARAGQTSGGSPRVSVYILPDNKHPGMLETLLCRTFADAADDRCIDDYFACVRAPVGRPEKARAHAWLATKPDPHVSVGVAAKKGYWDLDHAVFADLRNFLAAL